MTLLALFLALLLSGVVWLIWEAKHAPTIEGER